MVRLLLTSTGFSNKKIANHFLEVINKKVSEIKVIFIPTASRSLEELAYVNESKKELISLGILNEHIKSLSLENKVSFEEIKEFDVIYVCGGNTFYLLKKVKDSGLGDLIKPFLASGKLYVGVSAGSIIACPEISIASPFDENDINLKDLTGLSLIDVIISPHYNRKEKSILENFKKRSSYKLIGLTDSQALSVIDEKTQIIE